MNRRLLLLVMILLLGACLGPVKPAPTATLAINQPGSGGDPAIMTAFSEAPIPAGDITYPINYVSYAALFSSRHIASPSPDEFRASSASWVDVTGNVISDLELPTRVSRLDEMLATSGFSSLDVVSELTYGPPGQINSVLRGRFDTPTIEAALNKRYYSQTKFKNLTMWCGDEECQTGMQDDLRHIFLADPFGGSTGRRQPTFVGEDVLVNAPDPGLVVDIVNRDNSPVPASIVHLLAAALKTGEVRQMRIIPAADVGVSSMGHFAMVDAWDGGQQVATVILCCADRATAATLGDRIGTGLRRRGITENDPAAIEAITGAGGALQQAVIDEDDPTQVLVSVSINYRTPPNARTLNDAIENGTARIYHLLFDLLESGAWQDILAGNS